MLEDALGRFSKPQTSGGFFGRLGRPLARNPLLCKRSLAPKRVLRIASTPRFCLLISGLQNLCFLNNRATAGVFRLLFVRNVRRDSNAKTSCKDRKSTRLNSSH